MDSAASAFVKNEARLQALRLRPSEYVARQVRVTPYPHEDAGWIIRNVGPDICMFSSDYPHVEGGRQPLKRFDASLAGLDAESVERFFSSNFADMMGIDVSST
jgi:predicted TIM-barrel fold metal-dependent hydrolase